MAPALAAARAGETRQGPAMFVAAVPAALAIAWGAAAIWLDGPTSRWLAATGSLAFVAAAGGALLGMRPRWRGAVAAAAVVGAVVAWWLSIPARNDRAWQADVARPATARFDGDIVTIENVRNFRWRSDADFTAHWETRRYDLSRLRALDLYLSDWGAPGIVHTIVAWEFEDAPPLAISIETRKEVGESYSALLGFFRHYELYYVVADERDVIGVRAAQRGERVRLYRLRATPERARELLLDYLREVNRLAASPRWYNAATQNCTTTIRHHVRAVGPRFPWSWKVLANAWFDELAYERGALDTSLPFAELRAASDVTEKAKAAAASPDFSRRIREGLPGFAPSLSGAPVIDSPAFGSGRASDRGEVPEPG